MARRSGSLAGAVCVIAVTLLALRAVSTGFSIGVRPRVAPKIARPAGAAYESGKINLGVEIGTATSQPKPYLEANEATNAAIVGCIDEGCSVESLLELDQKLARDEQRVLEAAEEVKQAQKTAFSQDNVESLVWYDNFLQRAGTLRAQLQALKGAKDSDFIKQLVKAASVAFGGGRETDYPKVGVSPYSG